MVDFRAARPNGTEPVRADGLGVADMAAQLQVLLRHIIMLIEEFQFLSKSSSESGRLANLVELMVKNAQDCFAAAALLHAEDLAARVDRERCLRELQALQHDLRARRRPPERELAHATDALLVQCVLLDRERSDAQGAG
jgi:hypothetical protein